MKKTGILLAFVATLAVLAGMLVNINNYPEKVVDIVKHWFLIWIKGGAIATIVIFTIFGINKSFKSEETMSRTGLIVMPVIISLLLHLFFGYNIWFYIIGTIAGIIIGYFSYVVDDKILEAWKMRYIFLPLFFGLGFGGSSIIAALTENWQNETIYVSDYATCNKLTIERYTYHYRSSDDGGSYYSWDTHKILYFFSRGEKFYQPIEGKDYKLGKGDDGTKDRAKFNYFKWIGGEKLSESGENLGFKWVYLTKIELLYEINTVYDIEENFFGQALGNGKIKDIPFPGGAQVEQKLPLDKDVPEVLSMSFNFFKIIATNKDFSLLRWIYFLIYIPFIVGSLFSKEWRIALLVFFISSTIVILIVISMILARSGKSISDLLPKFGGFGGGSSGGAGAGGRW